jgi:hypothetical protein
MLAEKLDSFETLAKSARNITGTACTMGRVSRYGRFGEN